MNTGSISHSARTEKSKLYSMTIHDFFIAYTVGIPVIFLCRVLCLEADTTSIHYIFSLDPTIIELIRSGASWVASFIMPLAALYLKSYLDKKSTRKK